MNSTPPVVSTVSIARAKLSTFFASQATPLTWAMALIAVNILIGGFFEQQGHLEFDNENIANASYYLSITLYLLAIFRLIKPRGSQDIQALILLLILPNLDKPVMYLGRAMLIMIVVLFRWTRLSRVVGLTAVTLSLLIGPVLMTCISIHGSGIPYSPKTGELCSKTDEIYCLYRFPCGWYTKYAYGLFREVPLLPGIKLVKRIDELATDKNVCVCTTPQGNYIIVDGPPRDYRFRQ
ncbi:hypothetical protein BH11CYA1_BH11CYA1_20080 [soil metagenome]